MLARKLSSATCGLDLPNLNSANVFNNVGPLADYGPDETSNETNVRWINKTTSKSFCRFLALLSLISVSLNTPRTFEIYPVLRYLTLIFDIVCLAFFVTEMMVKIYARGLLSGEKPYLKDRWCQFDMSMAFFILLSIILQLFEMTDAAPKYSPLSIIRSPRPLIIIRFIRVFLRFSMPKARINQIIKRSSQQIYNVTIFFLFFMSLYGLLGVQFFGELNNHCVRNSVTKPSDVTLDDLTVPDSYCNPKPGSGHQCTKGYHCMKLSSLGRLVTGFTGFDEFAISVFTVYQAASQEGWVYIMYRAGDSAQYWKAAFYFTTMIFFLSWMVRNVFIAVITETFNEIRVQFQETWGDREHITGQNSSQVLESNDRKAWKLVTVYENNHKGIAPEFLVRFLHSPAYHIIVMLITLANAIVTASISFKHTKEQKPRHYYFMTQLRLELLFTLFYDLEVLFKIFCLSFKGYISRSTHKFELLLAITTTVHILPIRGLFLSWISMFQVLRVIRLIKVSPMLVDFVYKIFGPGKKLGSLIIFTMCLLIVSSSISMQLFCNLRGLETFETFPFAFMSMFQILTQEAWPEVMLRTMQRVNPRLVVIVAAYFILYHLFVTLIVMSLFVAVILDNLELDEDAKKIKQLKVTEESSDIKEELPLRLRVFEKFPERPLMTKLGRIPSEFLTPKVRDSFVTKFVYENDELHDIVVDDDQLQRMNSSILPSNGTKKQDDNGMCLRYRKKTNMAHLLSSPTRKVEQSSFIKKASVSNIIWSVRRSMRVGSQLLNKRGGTYRINETKKENGFSPRGGLHNSVTSSSTRPQNIDIKLLHAKKQQAEMRRNQKEEDLRENHPFFDRPLFAVPRESTFRRICQTIVNSRYDSQLKDPTTGKERNMRFKTIHKLLGLVTYLDWFMIIITSMTMISMMFEKPNYRVMDNQILQVMDYTFVIAMGSEITLKVLAEGLLFTPKALIRDVSGVIDIFIFIVSTIWVGWMPKDIPANSLAQYFLILRCCRPLRMFILVPHMRKVVRELCRGFKEIFLVAVLLIVLIFVFANYGVHLFGLRFAGCTDRSITKREECVGVYRTDVFVTKMNISPKKGCPLPGFTVPRIWMNPRRFNFDNIGNSMLALFEVLSYKGWIDLRDVIIHKMGPAYAIYIHMYVFLGSMIGLTLFVGVVIANYRENKGTALLTVDQMRWSDLKKRLKIAQPLHVPPKPENSRFQGFIYSIVQHIYFKRFIAMLVLINSFLLCVKWNEEENQDVANKMSFGAALLMPTTTRKKLSSASAALTICFVVEVIMKMIAFTPYGYWQSLRNRGDLFVTLLGVAWIALDYILSNQLTLTLGYVVIILRFFTITGKHATLKMLMQTVIVSMYKSFFIIMSMFLLITCYALAGVILFGSVKFGEAINRHANFQTSINGIFMLFRIVTGEDWNRVLHDCMRFDDYCNHQTHHNYWDTDCGNFIAALAFFCSFYVIITYIVLNLLVAIIMENFSLFYSNEEDALLSYADIRNFQITWNIVDINQRGMIPIRRVKFILRLLRGRLDVDPQKDRLLFKHMCYEMERLRNGEDVTFHDLLSMLSYRSVDIRKALQLEELLAREELEYIIEEEVAKMTIRKWLDDCLRRIREKEQSLIAGLRAMNEPMLQMLRPLEELYSEDEENVKQPISSLEEVTDYKIQTPTEMATSRNTEQMSVSSRRFNYDKVNQIAKEEEEADFLKRNENGQRSSKLLSLPSSVDQRMTESLTSFRPSDTTSDTKGTLDDVRQWWENQIDNLSSSEDEST